MVPDKLTTRCPHFSVGPARTGTRTTWIRHGLFLTRSNFPHRHGKTHQHAWESLLGRWEEPHGHILTTKVRGQAGSSPYRFQDIIHKFPELRPCKVRGIYLNDFQPTCGTIHDALTDTRAMLGVSQIRPQHTSKSHKPTSNHSVTCLIFNQTCTERPQSRPSLPPWEHHNTLPDLWDLLVVPENGSHEKPRTSEDAHNYPSRHCEARPAPQQSTHFRGRGDCRDDADGLNHYRAMASTMFNRQKCTSGCLDTCPFVLRLCPLRQHLAPHPSVQNGPHEKPRHVRGMPTTTHLDTVRPGRHLNRAHISEDEATGETLLIASTLALPRLRPC
ncbi:hypothetical protein Lal_00043590 [Lupinus albus]|nr:hypothetical protein Lal_00043590 [Lupinus albus]